MNRGAVVTSLQNPAVRLARKLTRRSARAREGAFLIEGPKAVAEAIDVGLDLRHVFVGPDNALEGVTGLGADAPLVRVTDDIMRAISDTVTPQGVVAVARLPRATLDELTESSGDLVLVLAGVRDPGNAGTLVRSALGAGLRTIVFTADSVDPFGPKTVRASAGALFRMNVVLEPSFDLVADRLRAAGRTLVGTAAGAATSAYEADLTRPLALVLGNEAWGLPPGLDLDEAIAIPMPGPLESLNVGIAGSLLLFEAVRQRSVATAEAKRTQSPLSSTPDA